MLTSKLEEASKIIYSLEDKLSGYRADKSLHNLSMARSGSLSVEQERKKWEISLKQRISESVVKFQDEISRLQIENTRLREDVGQNSFGMDPRASLLEDENKHLKYQ